MLPTTTIRGIGPTAFKHLEHLPTYYEGVQIHSVTLVRVYSVKLHTEGNITVFFDLKMIKKILNSRLKGR